MANSKIPSRPFTIYDVSYTTPIPANSEVVVNLTEIPPQVAVIGVSLGYTWVTYELGKYLNKYSFILFKNPSNADVSVGDFKVITVNP